MNENHHNLIPAFTILAIIVSVALSMRWTSRWFTCGLVASVGGALVGAWYTYSSYKDLPSPERGIEWVGSIMTCAVLAGVTGAISAAIRSRLAARGAR